MARVHCQRSFQSLWVSLSPNGPLFPIAFHRNVLSVVHILCHNPNCDGHFVINYQVYRRMFYFCTSILPFRIDFCRLLNPTRDQYLYIYNFLCYAWNTIDLCARLSLYLSVQFLIFYGLIFEGKKMFLKWTFLACHSLIDFFIVVRFILVYFVYLIDLLCRIIVLWSAIQHTVVYLVLIYDINIYSTRPPLT